MASKPPRNKRIDRRKYLSALGMVGAGVATAGCSSNNESKDDTNGSNGNTLIVGQNTKMSGDEPLDPHRATRIGTQEVLFAINEPLFRVNPDLKPVPHLAKKYSMNDDATEYTLTLEEGIKFHNGEKLTAEVAKWNLDRFVNESPMGYLAGNVSKTEVTGDYEITVKYDNSFPLLPRGLSSWNSALVSKKAVKKAGDKYGQNVIVGTGPYKFKNWSRGAFIETERFDEYDWGPNWVQNTGPGKVKKFRFESHPEPTTLLNELTDGDVHLSKSVLLSDAKKVEQNSNTGLKRKKFTRQAYLCPNTQKEPMNDVRVRKAVTYAIKKDAVIEAALGGEGYDIWALMPPMAKNALSTDRAKETGQQFNPEKARSLLEQAGWTNSEQGQVRSKGGKKLQIDFLTFTISREKKIGTTIQPMLDEVGFKTNLKILEAGTLYKKLEAGEHDLVVMGYGGQYALETLSATLTSDQSAKKGGTNFSLWENKKFDNLLQKARTFTSDEKRNQAIVDAQLIVQEQAPVVPVLAYNKILGYKNSVSGVDTMTNDHPWWPVKEYLRHLELEL
ncbi:ABC transporter substrate-binding protein [Haladaptatus sp. SPP-AMP-3]|uniref:ABC transporter substrate-binding protein n=1 Tax=Haladaptatus sp. SPP-AMP-3 TaxID=3121295 RepID=UPI003C2D8C50